MGEMNGNGNGKLKALVPVAVWVAGTLVSVSLAYGAVQARLDVLEVKYERLFQDISEIKGDVKLLLRRER